MILKILLILIGLPILILPLTTDLIKNKRLTKPGFIFLAIVVVFASFEIIIERQNSSLEAEGEKEKGEMVLTIDSLSIKTKNLSDSLVNLKTILMSIDSQFYYTNYSLSELQIVNDSLSNQLINSDRPILNLSSTKIVKSNLYKDKYEIQFIFINEGKRALTKVKGVSYSIKGFAVYDHGTASTTINDIYSNNKGFTIHHDMKFNPDSTSLKEPIYYYFEFTYSDLILSNSYSFDIVMKMIPFEKGNHYKELVSCRNWENEKIKIIIEHIKTNAKGVDG